MNVYCVLTFGIISYTILAEWGRILISKSPVLELNAERPEREQRASVDLEVPCMTQWG